MPGKWNVRALVLGDEGLQAIIASSKNFERDEGVADVGDHGCSALWVGLDIARL